MLTKTLNDKVERTNPLEYHLRLRFEISVILRPPAIASEVEFVGMAGT